VVVVKNSVLVTHPKPSFIIFKEHEVEAVCWRILHQHTLIASTEALDTFFAMNFPDFSNVGELRVFLLLRSDLEQIKDECDVSVHEASRESTYQDLDKLIQFLVLSELP